MKGTRNKRKNTNSKSEDELNKSDDSAFKKDNLEKIKSGLSDDLSDDASCDEEIDRKINAVIEKSKNNLYEEENQKENYKNDKIKKQKYDKKLKKNQFNDYFDSYTNFDDYYEVNYPELSKYELKIDMYSDLFKLISKNKIFPTLLKKDVEKFYEENNKINSGNLNKIMSDLIYHNYNIFLYGFGSKIRLIYNFIDEYLKKYNEESDSTSYLIYCNLNNFEINFNTILNKIQNCLHIEFDKLFNKGFDLFKSEYTINDKITKLSKIYEEIFKKFNGEYMEQNGKKEEKEEEDELKSNLEELDSKNSEFSEELNKNLKNSHDNKDLIVKKTPFKILLILNNIGSNIGQNKSFHQNLTELIDTLDFINLLVTCENLVIPHFWTLEIKNKYRFCFLKFHTYEPYDSEIDENNSIKMTNNIREGNGLKEIFSSFSETQKRLMKEIAILTLKGDHEHLTQKGLVNYFVETGIGIVTDIQKLETLIMEAIDHDIVELKVSNENNREIYKMNLEKNIIEKIAEGEFM